LDGVLFLAMQRWEMTISLQSTHSLPLGRDTSSAAPMTLDLLTKVQSPIEKGKRMKTKDGRNQFGKKEISVKRRMRGFSKRLKGKDG